MVLCRANTVEFIWKLSNFTGGERPQMSLRALLQAHTSRTIDVPYASWIASSHEKYEPTAFRAIQYHVAFMGKVYE